VESILISYDVKTPAPLLAGTLRLRTRRSQVGATTDESPIGVRLCGCEACRWSRRRSPGAPRSG